MQITNHPPKTGHSRPTIGVIMDAMVPGYQLPLWRGLKQAAAKADVNLLCFLGREFEEPIDFRQKANAIYKQVNQKNIDALVLLTGTVNSYVDAAFLKDYTQKLLPIPTVSIAIEIDKVPSILLDNRKGVREAVAHLIEVHHRQRIGFVRLIEGHDEGDQRFEAYRETLEEFGLPYDPDLVVPGVYYDHPEEAIRVLFDERKVSPDALMVVDDYMAIPMMEALRARGISVPEEIAVVGFDDAEEARYAYPPLTTLRQPLWEQAHLAIEMALRALEGKPLASLRVELAPKLIIRQSCGCFSADVLKAGSTLDVSEPLANSLGEYQAQIFAHLLEPSYVTEKQNLLEFLETFNAAIELEDSRPLLDALDDILQKSISQGEEISAWQNVISGLRPFVKNILQKQPALTFAENLLQQCRVLIAEVSEQVQAKHRFHSQQQYTHFRYLSQGLNATQTTENLAQVIAQGLPMVGLNEFYVSLYENENPDSGMLALLLAHNPTDSGISPSDDFIYPANQLLPTRFLECDERTTRIVKALSFEEEQYGFITIEDQLSDESLYEALADQISSGLKGAKLFQQAQRRAVLLQTAFEVSQAANSLLDPDVLIHQTVDLVKSRFDLYYVGLFLTDEERQWAVLRAGTGEAGQKMLDANWQLEIGGSSMIGRCIATGQPDIQLDVDKAPIHLRNPHLPETKSEIALPLISRGEITGALTIQSTLANAFSPEDITVFQTMSAQLANAIGNAGLYDALAREQYLMNALMDNVPEAIYFKDRESRFTRISRYMIGNFGVEDPAEIIGKTDFDFFTEEHARPAFKDEQRIIRTGEALLNLEERETWGNRPDTWVLTSKLPLKNERGEIIGTFGLTRDITDLKKTQITLEKQSQQLKTTIAVAQAISEILDPHELTQQIVNLIKEYFDSYYVGLFTTDKNEERAILQAGTGEPGKQMLAEGWSLKIDDTSMIGRCLRTGEPNIQLDIEKAPIHLRNPHLPETKSEIALPLFSRGKALGAISIQSNQPNAFSDEDTPILQNMANQISVALANARLFEQTQTALIETETLLNVTRVTSSTLGIEFALPQILDLVLKATQFDAGLFSFANPSTQKLELRAHHLPEPMLEKLTSQGLDGTLCDLVYRRAESISITDLTQQTLVDATGLLNLGFVSYEGVPIKTKGSVFGTLCLFSNTRLDGEGTHINLLEAVGQQVGVAIENMQLLEQTQQTLAELESTQKRYQIQAWATYNQSRNQSGYLRKATGLEPLSRQPKPETQIAIQRQTPVITQEEQGLSLTIPIMLRDQPIGAIGLQAADAKRQWTPEEVALVQEISEQFALAAESLRLLDETQRRAARERLVTEITTKLRASNDPQAMLQTAAQELRAALNAKRAQVLLQPNSANQPHPDENQPGSQP